MGNEQSYDSEEEEAIDIDDVANQINNLSNQ